MKTVNYNMTKTITLLIGLAVLATPMSPVAARGLEVRPKDVERERRTVIEVRNSTTTDNKPTCERINSFSTTVTTRLVDHEAKLATKAGERVAKLENRKETTDTRRATNRDQWDTNRAERFAKLRARATTDVQKQAVESFVTTIESAVKIRRTAIDTAVATYRAGLTAEITERQTAVTAYKKTFDAAVAAALGKAKTACQNGTDIKTVRDTLQADLKTARDQFTTNLKALERPNTDIQRLKDTRNAAVKKAQDDFKTTLTKALETLKTIFAQ